MGIHTTHLKKTKDLETIEGRAIPNRRHKKTKKLVRIPDDHRFYCTSCGGFHYIKFHDIHDDLGDYDIV